MFQEDENSDWAIYLYCDRTRDDGSQVRETAILHYFGNNFKGEWRITETTSVSYWER